MNKTKLLNDTFRWLFIGLLVCGVVSYLTSLSDSMIIAIYGGYKYIIYCIIELVICVYFTTRIQKMSPTAAKLFYLVYCGVTGLTLSGIFLIYEIGSIAVTFIITSLIFGLFAYLGNKIDIDLSRYGSYALVALIAILVLELINLIFLGNSLNMVLSMLVIIIFCFYTAYDINRLLRNNYLSESENKPVYFAFELFLDFINIFLELLKIFGRRK